MNRLATRPKGDVGNTLVEDVEVLGGRWVDPWGFFPRPQYMSQGLGAAGNFCFVANWTAFPLLSGQCPSPCSAQMMGQ